MGEGVRVDPGWHNTDGNWVSAYPETVRRLEKLLLGPETPPYGRPTFPNDGAVVAWPEPHRWGVTLQVGPALTAVGPGIGTFESILAVGRWLADRGGSVLGLSPLCEPIPRSPREPSPYSPSSRAHLDPLLLATGGHVTFPSSAAMVDRDAAWARFLAEEGTRFAALAGTERATLSDGFDSDTPRRRHHAVFNALTVDRGTRWQDWPAELRRADPEALERWTAEHPAAVLFWWWLDQRTTAEWTATRRRLDDIGVTPMGDLPVGVARDGFDAWIDSDIIDGGWSVGAPPDTFNPRGQDWGLPPYDPARLAAGSYRSLAASISQCFEHFGGLRVDHVMGLSRLFWVPVTGPDDHVQGPRAGTYVHYPEDDLWGLVTSAANDVDAFVVGEDLGTVPDEVRSQMDRRGIAGTRVAWFEHGDPADWPQRSLGSLSTHDLPTVVGALRGTDPDAPDAMVQSLLAFARCSHSDDPFRVSATAHRRLAESGSGIVLAALEDVVGSDRRVNLPGTIDEYPNWRQPLPFPVDRLDECDFATRITHEFNEIRPR
jgi:4-alpha-glucanotransferase